MKVMQFCFIFIVDLIDLDGFPRPLFREYQF